jgi:hypothetical protein
VNSLVPHVHWSDSRSVQCGRNHDLKYQMGHWIVY